MRRSRGFTLVEIVVVLVIMSVVIAMAAVLVRAIGGTQRRSTTVTKITTVDAALTQFVVLNKRLPCPADGRKGATNDPANAGREEGAPGACSNNQQHGVVPWKALGISEADILDGWDRRLTYRVDQNLTAANAMDLTACDPAGTAALVGGLCAPTPGCNSASTCSAPGPYVQTKGLTVQNAAGTIVMQPPTTGAAYVLVSHGESGGGGYLSSGEIFSSTSVDGTSEQLNYANVAAGGNYGDDSIMEASGTGHFDDIVSRPTILAVATKAGLGPRSHP